jgi:DNA-binding NtrC family response regulator
MVYWVYLMTTKKNNAGKNKSYSISRQLKKEGRSNEELEVSLSKLSLEEVIALKLEVTTRDLLKGKFYGFPVWKSLKYIISDAVVKYALSATQSKREAARFLGIQEKTLIKLVRQYRTEEYFEKNIDSDSR